MSRLRELRLHGFKTFADPTRFLFEPGVNAVIGPNGSGKSNMADAVRWVLGEQSNRSLRTRRADDVIFGGSQHRKPQGMAEALLTLDNTDGWLPIEFAEVTIGRRAYRSGESEYMINGARARLRDVVELLGEGRLGANELVVVGQGTVDAALSLRPGERRQLFEEAAGVKNLQVRKNEALSRLARASDNLSRVRDLIGELKPQVRRLALQAQHQQEHDQLGRRARAMVLESHRRREATERDALGEARRRAAAAEAELEGHRAEQDARRRAVAGAEERYWQADTAARSASEALERAREVRIRAESRLDALEGRVADLERAVADDERSLREVEAGLAGSSSAAPGSGDIEHAIRAAADAEAAWNVAGRELRDADARLLEAERASAAARQHEAERIASAARSREEHAAAVARTERLTTELDAVRAEAATIDAGLEPARAGVEGAAAALEATRARHEASLTGLSEAQRRADEARKQAAELAERVGTLRGELEALHELAERRGRLAAMLTTAGWGSLLDVVDVGEEAWPAIEAVVGSELEQAFLWREEAIVERLSTAEGTARLLRIGEPGVDPDERRHGLEAVRATDTLADRVGGRRVPELFWRVAWAPDVEALVDGWRELPAGWLAVTPFGDLADGRGVLVLRGHGEAPAAEGARRHARRRELAEAVERLEVEQEELTAQAARARAAVSEALRELDATRSALSDAEAAAVDATAARGQLEGRREALETRIDELAAALQASDLEQSAVTGPDVTADWPANLAALEEAATTAREVRHGAAERAEAAGAAWRAARAAADDAERRLGSGGSRTVLEARRAQLAADLPTRQASLAAAQGELETQRAEVDAARRADAAAVSDRTAAEEERDRLRTALRALEGEGGPAAERLASLEAAAQAGAIEASRREDALAALDRERELALESIPESEGESEGSPDARETTELHGLDETELAGELRKVRRTLTQIGSVNPFAVEEHRELSARLDDLTGQDADLSSAIDATRALIARLEAEIAEQFHAAFIAIGERFDEFCRLLFAGGSASLQLGDDEDGEAPGGIEIVVRPPGKRLQRLAMLSGGERALTGVALLFAMLSVNPVPFCILDEVDAALDEANIGRFADALRRLAERIDFVVITHNRATIEVADTIYGVTMTDAAVSRVVALRLADLPAEATVEVLAR